MRVVNTRTSNTVFASNKQLAEGSDEVSQSMETGDVQDGQWQRVIWGCKSIPVCLAVGH